MGVDSQIGCRLSDCRILGKMDEKLDISEILCSKKIEFLQYSLSL